jgi:hypothetical protein
MRDFARVALLSLLTLPWNGCAKQPETLQLYSSGRIGCSPDEIEISEAKHRVTGGVTADTWLATCRGKTYRCTYVSGSSPDISCAPKAE